MMTTVANVETVRIGILTMAPILLIAVAGWLARRWWVRQQAD